MKLYQRGEKEKLATDKNIILVVAQRESQETD
jgi:hypothetical protein